LFEVVDLNTWIDWEIQEFQKTLLGEGEEVLWD